MKRPPLVEEYNGQDRELMLADFFAMIAAEAYMNITRQVSLSLYSGSDERRIERMLPALWRSRVASA